MVCGAEERLREYRRMLPGGDRSSLLDGIFWDAVVLTAANATQAHVYVAQLDALHGRGQLPGKRAMYLVIADPRGPRVGSGGATLNVMLQLQAIAGSGWGTKKVFLLHAGGYAERSPAHGTLGKAFGQIPMDAANLGVPATILEAQLVAFTDLAKILPPGVFVSSADVAVQFGKLPALDNDDRAQCHDGVLALAHASCLDTGTGHGVFVCDRGEVGNLVSNTFSGSAFMASGAGGATITEKTEQESVKKKPPSALRVKRCLQKPPVSLMRASGAVLASPVATGHTCGSSDEWVLTDSAFHIGAGACAALTRVAATNPGVFAGVEICAYGDFMQPMGDCADSGYVGRVDHVASLSSVVTPSALNDAGSSSSAKGTDAARRLVAARELLATVIRGRPLLALPLLPSRFVHVGTMPELLQHCVRDDETLAAFPAPPAGIANGTWDVEMMDLLTARLPSVGADGVWGAAPGVGVGSRFLASRVDRGARVGTGSLVVHCDIGRQTVVGEGCLLHDVDLPHGTRVPPGTFLHCVPLGAAAAVAAGFELGIESQTNVSNDLNGGAHCWTCIVLSIDDEVKKPGHSTLGGVDVELAASRLGFDTACGDAVWSEFESHTTTLARVFPVCATSGEAVVAALDLLAEIRRAGGGKVSVPCVSRQSSRSSGDTNLNTENGAEDGPFPGSPRGNNVRSDRIPNFGTSTNTNTPEKQTPLTAAPLRVSISEALRVLANHAAAVARRDALRGRVIGHAVSTLLARDTAVQSWRERAPPLRALRPKDARRVCELADASSKRGGECGSSFLARQLRVARVALALANSPGDAKHAELVSKICLRNAVVAPFARGGALFGRQAMRPTTTTTQNQTENQKHAQKNFAGAYSVRAEYPARLNLAGGWTDTPPYALERVGAVLHVAVLVEETLSTASGSGGGKLKRPIAATARVDPALPRGTLRLVTDDTTETIMDIREMLTHDDPTHHFALLRACASLAIAPQYVLSGKDKEELLSGKDKDKATNQKTLAEVLDAFTGVPNAGVEIATRVDLPRGSGLGTSSILALAILHALHEMGTRMRWTPNGGGEETLNTQWAGRSAVVGGDADAVITESAHTRETRAAIATPSSRHAFNAVLAVEQMMGTGGGWQDAIGGALIGARLTKATPGTHAPCGLNSLPSYQTRVSDLPPTASMFLSRHLVCVFTGECRLAQTVAVSVVHHWQARVPGVEKALRSCALLAGQMADALAQLGALDPEKEHFTGAGSERARSSLTTFGAALSKHRAIQETLWPSIASPTVTALYELLEPMTSGSHICGAGNGGHVVCLLKPGVDVEQVRTKVANCAQAPGAKVTRVRMMLGGVSTIVPTTNAVSTTVPPANAVPTVPGVSTGTPLTSKPSAAGTNIHGDKPLDKEPAPVKETVAAPALGVGNGSGGRGRSGRVHEQGSGRGRKKRRTG